MPAHAQVGMVQQINPDADRLAEEMRVLAADPRNVRALLEAGKLSAELGDTAAAIAFYARAETIDPTNPRIAAGRASALVRMERPGEALRLFQTAEARGLAARDYAADRGFAYDLLGQPGLAQADYKLALQGTRDDETIRRYALSLGITGDVEESMRQLDPLLRKSDRAAWRARAFILAMNGDMPGAERIATSMMPGNMGHSLAPFFRRLANLAPADRAFAVHFGQLSPTAARLADARMAPVLPRYVAPARPVLLAQAPPQSQAARPVAAQNDARDRRSRRQRERDARAIVPPATRTAATQPAPAQPAPAQTAAADPLPAPPSVARAQVPMVQPLPAPRAEEIDAPVRESAAPVEVARRETAAPAGNLVTAPGQGGPAAVVAGDTAPATPAPGARTPVPGAPAAAEPVAAAPAPRAAESLPASARPTQEGSTASSAVAVAARPEPAPPGPARVGQEDSVLAAIVAGITIPGEELRIVSVEPVELPAEPARAAAAAPTPPAARPEPARARPEPARPEPPKGKEAKKPEPAKPDPKAKKPEPAKPDPKAKKPDPKKDPAKAEPKRIWVQVAGGANEASLPKAWKAVVAKAPALKGKAGWWTPLRATNRVLTGPFKTAAEAQAFVNTLGKSGVSGFVFTSEAGQKVTRLGAE
ncbi:tetratricopeptide (TPR) repeat protein [Sphingomonas naasensis]|uniref:SPOR domain-containing protein n=2 Tax=Sphingomonas naasensis TaxID=1344951 RepID=UPI001FB9BD13|nr:SPOR domain-containing protein [Sphingomonas naasensis]NIJ20624.1 tetratricopeptide (TPR) repeat protein [Sphingomonas naasensis]